MAYLERTVQLFGTTLTRSSSSQGLVSRTLGVKASPPALPPRIGGADFPRYDSLKNVSGTIYDINGAAVPSVTVKLFRQMDDTVVQTGTTDAQGRYFFPRDSQDTTQYYVLAYTGAVSPQVHGVSDRGVLPQ